jgi:hypothetical protein
MKRSAQVALLLMGVTGAGASAYAVLPPRACTAPDKPAALVPGAINPQTLAPGIAPGVQPAAPCVRSRYSSWGHRSYWSGRSYGYNSSPTQPSGRRSLFSPSRSHTSVPSVGHRSGSSSGFGSTGHSVGAHSSGT